MIFGLNYSALDLQVLESESTALNKVSYWKVLLQVLKNLLGIAFVISICSLDYYTNHSLIGILKLVGWYIFAIVFLVTAFFIDILIRRYRIKKELKTRLK